MKTNSNQEIPSLTHLQKWMRWILTSPRGVNSALTENTHLEPLPRCLNHVKPTSPLNRPARLSIYAEAYFTRILDALAKDFETLHRVLKHDRFQILIAEYLMKYPSHYFNISEVGCHLPTFIRSHRMAKEFPFLVDLTAFEWALIEVFYADDVGSLDFSKLSHFDTHAWEHAKILLHPSVRLLKLKYPIDKLWFKQYSKQAFEKLFPIMPEVVFILIHRMKDHGLAIKRLSLEQWNILRQLQQGITLSLALRGAPKVSNIIGKWFSEWISSEIIYDIKTSLMKGS